ncbi:MAG: site-2 protease family protein, partial [Planctomycetota bacterium]
MASGGYGYGDEASGWQGLLRRLSVSFHLGRFFGVEVRVYWLTLVILPVFGWIEFARLGLPGVQVATLTIIMTLGLYGVVYTHEMGHILAARRYGILTPLITLSPLGGVAHLSSAAPNPRAEIRIALAGPATHLLWLAVFWPLSWFVGPATLRPEGWWISPFAYAVEFLRTVNLWLMIFNLLPFLPLDGGRVLRALLVGRFDARRATVIAARVGQVGAVAFVFWGLFREAP